MMQEFYDKLLGKFKGSSRLFYSYFGEKYTYGDCFRNMKKIHAHLSSVHQKKVALYGSKSFSVYSAIYSIVLSNNIWVPLSPELPTDRILAMLDVLKPDVLIVEDTLGPEMSAYLQARKISTISLKAMLNQDKAKDFGTVRFQKDEWAYIMFTSGSTGVPKGVPMTHENYINFINNALEILPFEEGEVFSDYHDFAFDISIFYLFCAPLTESAIAPIKKKEEKIFPLNHMQENRVTVWSSVPSVLASLQRFRPDEVLPNHLKVMFICGEPFKLDLLDYCYKFLQAQNVYNFYGLTETGVENFYHPCSPNDLTRFQEKGFVPVGRPLKGNCIYVSEEKELLVSGCQITPDYLGGLGQDRFVEIKGQRWFRTGDIVEAFEDVYFCKGRLDSQVKVSGHRIELMDIEVHIRQHEDIKESVCFVDSERAVPRIICAIEPKAGREANTAHLALWLKDRLAEYMIPKIFFKLSPLPVNNNGKIDRKAISQAYFAKNRVQDVPS